MAQPDERPQANPTMAREEIERFLQQPLVGILGWVTAKGDLASSPVWHEYRDGKIWIASSSAFAKARSIARHPAVSFCVQDPEPPYRYVSVRATAQVHEDKDAAHALDTRLAVHYLGPAGGRYYAEHIAPTYPGEGRLLELTPTHVTSMDGTAGMDPAVLATMRAVRAAGK
jgi:PPOX class probable F420-dependent enzyme